MDVTLIITTLITALLSGGIGSVVTAKATRKKSELENVEEAVKIWREMAESLREELSTTHDSFAQQIEGLRKEVVRLSNIQSKIVKLLDKLTPENLEKMVEQIKNEIHENNG